MGPRLKVSSDRLVKPGIEPATPGLQGKRFIHYTTATPTDELSIEANSVDPEQTAPIGANSIPVTLASVNIFEYLLL